jgi:hypothetical protein
MAFIEVKLTLSEEQLAREALEKLVTLIEAKGVVGWEPSDADLEVILLGVIAMMALNVATVAAVVPPAIFRAFGTQLVKIPYNEGASATALTTWTIIPAEGVREIEADTTIEAGGHGFAVEVDTEVPAKATSVTLQVVAVGRGTEYNGVGGVARQTNPIDFVPEVQFVGETTGGAEQETDEEYLNRLTEALKLQAPRPITASDYAIFVLDVPAAILPAGVRVGRATAIDGYNAVTKGEGVERCVTTFVTDPEGKALSAPAMEAIETWVRGFREINFLAQVEAPSYSKVFITCKLHVASGYAPEAVLESVESALLGAINPKTWGMPVHGDPGAAAGWVNERPGKVRYNTILGLVEALPGVAYVFPGSEGLKIGTSAGPTGTADLSLEGPAPLPETSVGAIILTAG